MRFLPGPKPRSSSQEQAETHDRGRESRVHRIVQQPGGGRGHAGAGPAGRRVGALRVERTAVEYVEQVLGTDIERPRLSWELSAPGHGARQSADQVQVALASLEGRSRTRGRWHPTAV
ncbi:glycoside hydrolase family 78 protein [Streptomyces muensis]|uniref:glycoside hydrolase family 78 protein n=1 Tax=Streptomyces muensis TaxID=1077944 RepID=UPI003FD7AE10